MAYIYIYFMGQQGWYACRSPVEALCCVAQNAIAGKPRDGNEKKQNKKGKVNPRNSTNLSQKS